MTSEPSVDDPIQAIALLEEPNRRRLYELVARSTEAVGRDDAAATLGMSRELAAFHLDRLVAAGLVDTEYRRRGPRSGPGAGRPAKLYRRSDLEVALSLPRRQYDLAADLLATTLDRLPGHSAVDVAATVARERGTAAGRAARPPGTRSGQRRRLSALIEVLELSGYEPHADPAAGTVWLRNCPYHALAEDHRPLTCGMNMAWAEGVIEGVGAPVSAELDPVPGRCCVVFHPVQASPEPDGAATRTGAARAVAKSSTGVPPK